MLDFSFGRPNAITGDVQITSAVFAALAGIAEEAPGRPSGKTAEAGTGFQFADLLTNLQEQPEQAELLPGEESPEQDLTAVPVPVAPSIPASTHVTIFSLRGFNFFGRPTEADAPIAAEAETKVAEVKADAGQLNPVAFTTVAAAQPVASRISQAEVDTLPSNGPEVLPKAFVVSEGQVTVPENRTAQPAAETKESDSLLIDRIEEPSIAPTVDSEIPQSAAHSAIPAVPQPLAVTPQQAVSSQSPDRPVSAEKPALTVAVAHTPSGAAGSTVTQLESLPDAAPVLPHGAFAGALRKTEETPPRRSESSLLTQSPAAAPSVAVKESTEAAARAPEAPRLVPAPGHTPEMEREKQPDIDIPVDTAKPQVESARIAWTAPGSESKGSGQTDWVRSADAPVANSRPAEISPPAENIRPQSSLQSLNVRVGEGESRTDLRFVHRNGNVEMLVRSASPEVASQLSAQLPELKQNLASNGWTADLQPSVDVAGRNGSAIPPVIHETSAVAGHVSVEARIAESVKSAGAANSDGDLTGNGNENDRHGRRQDYLADENRQGRRGRRDQEIYEDD